MKAPEGLAHCVGGIPWVPSGGFSHGVGRSPDCGTPVAISEIWCRIHGDFRAEDGSTGIAVWFSALSDNGSCLQVSHNKGGLF
jgi:hypothetical protein